MPTLPGDPEWANYENLPWEDYARLVRSAHVEDRPLIDTPHPSYPPLDLAASGAAVVADAFDTAKTDLTTFLKNIIASPPTDRALADAINPGRHYLSRGYGSAESQFPCCTLEA